MAAGVLAALIGCSAWGAEPRPLNDVLFDATRYADSPARRVEREAARAELKQRMPDAFRTAMTYINGDRVMVQVLAMEWVLELPDEELAPVLLEYLDHDDPATRRIAVYFLGFLDTPQHAERVMPHLDHETTRGAALRTLGKWKHQPARAAAETALREGHERLRVVAANTLRDLGDPAAAEALMAALDDRYFTVRHAAARALVVLGEPVGPAVERAAAEAASARVREMSRRVLEQIKGEAPSFMLDDRAVIVDGAWF